MYTSSVKVFIDIRAVTIYGYPPDRCHFVGNSLTIFLLIVNLSVIDPNDVRWHLFSDGSFKILAGSHEPVAIGHLFIKCLKKLEDIFPPHIVIVLLSFLTYIVSGEYIFQTYFREYIPLYTKVSCLTSINSCHTFISIRIVP